MISLSHGLKVFVCCQPTDMRRSFDRLCGQAQQVLKQDPLSGNLFVFRNRNRDRLKILYWDRDGLAIWYKRLEQGTYQFPSDLPAKDGQPSRAEITLEELSLLLGGIDLASVRKRKRYERPNKPR